MATFNHETVLLNEAVDGLTVKPQGIYVDATLGGGGHSQLILNQLKTGHLYSFDQDQIAIDNGNKRFKQEITDGKSILIKSNFRRLKETLAIEGITQIDGIVYDLGVSSPQFDETARGFSYQKEAPLDMRMNQQQSLDAYEVVNAYPYSDLVRIFYRYGEEKFSKQIARKIEKIRETHPIETTTELAEIIKSAIPAAARRTGGHPAKKVFQAIRIEVNDELGAVEESLEQAIELLAPTGRISVITFHSLEDRIVKTMFKEASSLPELPPGLPVIPEGMKPIMHLINRKPILPSPEEVEHNRRARSAKLRVAEKNE